MNFGENLKILRKESTMSQEELAEKLGVTRQSVSKWEVGTAYPEMSNIVALCSIFHCNINDLVNDNTIDIDSFDKDTKENIVKFKKNQQKNMKKLSKAIYIISNICRIVILIPTICIIIMCLVFPFISRNIKIESDKIKIFNHEINYTIENNVLTIFGEEHYISSSRNIKEFITNHNNTFFMISIEYILLCVSILSMLTVLFLNSLYKLYKNIYSGDTPFTITNEKIVHKAIFYILIQIMITKVTAVAYSLIAHIDLEIEFNIKDIILVLVSLSFIYIFKYGRMLQANSNAKIYGNID